MRKSQQKKILVDFSCYFAHLFISIFKLFVVSESTGVPALSYRQVFEICNGPLKFQYQAFSTPEILINFSLKISFYGTNNRTLRTGVAFFLSLLQLLFETCC